MIIRVIDFETTGQTANDEVVEAAYCDLNAETRGIVERADWLCKVAAIPPEVRAVHHIRMGDIPPSAVPFHALQLCLQDVDFFAAHNSEFEAMFFYAPKPWICTYKAALRVWPDAPSHSNGALRYWLEDQDLVHPTHELTQPAHRAGPDAYVTAHILSALLRSGATIDQLVQWTLEPRLMPRCPIGKFRGKPWSEVEGGFLDWMLRQSDMEADLKWNAQRELNRRFGQ